MKLMVDQAASTLGLNDLDRGTTKTNAISFAAIMDVAAQVASAVVVAGGWRL